MVCLFKMERRKEEQGKREEREWAGDSPALHRRATEGQLTQNEQQS